MKSVAGWFYVGWIVPGVIVALMPFPQSLQAVHYNVVICLSVAVYLLIAASMAHRVVCETLLSSSRQIWGCFVVVGALFACLYTAVYLGGGSSTIVDVVWSANLLFGATLLGGVLSSAVKRVGELVPVCLTAAVADAMSVAMGPTRSMAEDLVLYYQKGREGPLPLVDLLVVKTVLPGSAGSFPLFGVTDWILVVLLSAALLRMKKTDNIFPGAMDRRSRTHVSISALGLYCAVVLAQLAGVFVPAMVFIAVFFVVFLFAGHDLKHELKSIDVTYSAMFPLAVAALLLLIDID